MGDEKEEVVSDRELEAVANRKTKFETEMDLIREDALVVHEHHKIQLQLAKQELAAAAERAGRDPVWFEKHMQDFDERVRHDNDWKQHFDMLAAHVVRFEKLIDAQNQALLAIAAALSRKD